MATPPGEHTPPLPPIMTLTVVKRSGAFTDQGGEQLQILLPDVQVETAIVQVHFRAAATEGPSAPPNLQNQRRSLTRLLKHAGLLGGGGQRPHCALPADDPVLGLGADVQSRPGVGFVQVEPRGGGVGAGGVQTDGAV